MKKKLYLASAIVLSLGLMACSPQPENEEVPVEDTTVDKEQDAENKLDDAQDNIDDAKEDIKDVEDTDADTDADKDVDEEGIMTSDEEMIEAADYIAVVNIVDSGDGVLKAELVEDLKGQLEGKEIPNDENFKKDTKYIVFLKDENGKPVPVQDENHYRAYNGPEDEIMDKIKKDPSVEIK